MNRQTANTILSKLGLRHIRAAHHGERQSGRWVLDRGERQALEGYESLDEALAATLEAFWPEVSAKLDRLTPGELRQLRSLRSQVARLI